VLLCSPDEQQSAATKLDQVGTKRLKNVIGKPAKPSHPAIPATATSL
jgi:hypothetical protein